MKGFVEKQEFLENPLWKGLICLLLLLFNQFISPTTAVSFLVVLLMLFIFFRFTYAFILILLFVTIPGFLFPALGWIVNAAFILFCSVLIAYSIASGKAFG